MPPKKVNIKKNSKSNKTKNETKNKKKLVSYTESSIRSADYDTINRDDYEITSLSEDYNKANINKEIKVSRKNSKIEMKKDTGNDTGKDTGTESEEESVEEEESIEEEENVDDEEENVEENVEEEEETAEEEETVEEETGDTCIYKKAKVKNFDADDNEELELAYDDDNNIFDEIVKPDDRITKPFMTIFERVRILGDRAKQLSLGAKPMIKGLEILNPKEVAKLELEKGVMPLIIERVLPNGKKERWYTHELKIIN